MNEPQEGAQTPEARIATVLREHRPQGINYTWSAPMCTCGDNGDYMAHAATLSVEALGLTPQLMHLNEYAAANGAEPEIQTRWVTKWEQA